ncbi:MAG: antibiotic biosynthesis monooxygenase [Alphaproteobacteria bacterium]|nr:MAG: antibiotic biosynthesis monooxygenase [Alphaproteobacteria bacterium]
MIARIWTGEVPAEKAEAYLHLMRDVAIPDYKSVGGNQGAWCLYRPTGNGRVSVTMLTHWQDMDAIKRFAGDRPEVAKFYDFDKEYLVEWGRTVDHYEVFGG